MWHSLDAAGNVAVYDVEWFSGNIETNIPASILEGVRILEGDIDEAHEAHGIKGHEINSSVSERVYKSRK